MAKSYSITSKYQVTIPQTVRESLNLTKHDKVEFTIQEGKVIIKKAPTLGELQTKLHKKFLKSKRKPATQAEIDNARRNFYQNGLEW